jgi:hypothetical protein
MGVRSRARGPEWSGPRLGARGEVRPAEVFPPPQRGLCPCPQIDHLDGEGRMPLEAMGLRQEGGGAGAAGEGDHEHTGGGDAAEGGCFLVGAAEHLAIAHRAGGDAVAGPLGGDGLHRPAEAMGSGGDGLIGTAGTAVEQELHKAATDGLAEGEGHAGGGPIEITATTGYHHQGTAVGAHGREQAKRRRGGRICGTRKEQSHGRLRGSKGGGKAARAPAGQGF